MIIEEKHWKYMVGLALNVEKALRIGDTMPAAVDAGRLRECVCDLNAIALREAREAIPNIEPAPPVSRSVKESDVALPIRKRHTGL